MKLKNLLNYFSIWCLAVGLLAAATVKYSYANGVVAGDDVPQTVAAIKAQLQEQGFNVIGVINHQAAAASVDLELRPTQVIFFRPSFFHEKLTLRKGGAIGLDLSWRILVYEDENGEIHVSSNTTGSFMDRHQIAPIDAGLQKIQSVIAPFTGFDAGIETVTSNLSFDDTVNGVINALPGAFRIPFIVNYDFVPNNGGFSNLFPGFRFPTLIVFGNPNVGTHLMLENQKIALELPQRFLIWQEPDDGLVKISYNNPRALARRFNITSQDARIDAMAAALSRFANAGAGNPP